MFSIIRFIYVINPKKLDNKPAAVVCHLPLLIYCNSMQFEAANGSQRTVQRSIQQVIKTMLTLSLF
jgi:hypothetical protein